jgi:hypothetical protein
MNSILSRALINLSIREGMEELWRAIAVCFVVLVAVVWIAVIFGG